MHWIESVCAWLSNGLPVAVALVAVLLLISLVDRQQGRVRADGASEIPRCSRVPRADTGPQSTQRGSASQAS
jgi:hypothetical protein